MVTTASGQLHHPKELICMRKMRKMTDITGYDLGNISGMGTDGLGGFSRRMVTFTSKEQLAAIAPGHRKANRRCPATRRWKMNYSVTSFYKCFTYV